MPGLLPQIVLEAAPDKGLILGLRRSHGDLMGETVQKRLDALAALLGRIGKVVVR
jgi:hypothetical protein